MRIVGLDVGRCSAVLCCLEKLPANMQEHYKKLRKEKKFYKVNCDLAGLEKLLSLEPDGIVLEPSGHWYSQFWVRVAKENDIPIYWVSHTALYCERGSHGFKNKRDEEDALCLAATYFDDSFVDAQGNKRYLKYYENEIISNLRELFLAKEQLQKLRTNLVSQLRQRLNYEFPEIAKSSMKISQVLGYSPLVYWLAENQPNARYCNKYKLSVAHNLGVNISDYTRNHAKLIIDIEKRYVGHLDQLERAIAMPMFDAYNRVFNKFSFGVTTRSLLLFNLYPFEKFLVDGKPYVERELGNNGKMQKRDRSLRKLQSFLGMSYRYIESGDKKGKKLSGSELIRAHLYIWAVCSVAPKNKKLKSDVEKKLSDRYQELRQTVKGKDALVRILFKATRLLYFELCKELVR